MTSARRAYPTDLTDAEWQVLAPLIPTAKPGGRPPIHDRRELVNALAYWVRAGCAWRLLPHDLPVEFVQDGREQALKGEPSRLHQQLDRVGTAIAQAEQAPQPPILSIEGGLERLLGVAE
jgi:hypothetical protein